MLRPERPSNRFVPAQQPSPYLHTLEGGCCAGMAPNETTITTTSRSTSTGSSTMVGMFPTIIIHNTTTTDTASDPEYRQYHSRIPATVTLRRDHCGCGSDAPTPYSTTHHHSSRPLSLYDGAWFEWRITITLDFCIYEIYQTSTNVATIPTISLW